MGEDDFYEEGDTCPSCKKGMLVVGVPSEATGGLCELRCQDCNYDATDDDTKGYTKNPWGWEKIIHQNKKWTVKLLHIKAGHQLSEQYHTKKGEFMFDEEKMRYFPAKTVHRPSAKGRKTDLEIIEVSTNVKDEIVRLKDDYGRK